MPPPAEQDLGRHEPFAWAPVLADIYDQVADVLAFVDRGCTELLDTEYHRARDRYRGMASGE